MNVAGRQTGPRSALPPRPRLESTLLLVLLGLLVACFACSASLCALDLACQRGICF